MCELAINLQKKLDEHQLQTESDNECSASHQSNNDINLFYLTKHLRNLMKDARSTKTECGNEKHEETHTDLQISYAAAAKIVPTDLYNYLAWLLTDVSPITVTNGRVPLPKTKHVLVISIALDMMANVTKIPMPKNVGLALHILKQMWSTELMRTLHNFGRSISNDEAQRNTSTAVQQTDVQGDVDDVFIPSTLTAGNFTQCALHNLDFSESTKDVSTLNATCQIVYQYQDNNDQFTSAKVSL